ncbi:hypothetical protein F511_13812 [Dorcoceras hygrometricum]|uniref:Uncharacterized protein n=1 Tax=Dorcoceras hygrometricum TaxID=472368 RepID=A0A2Z7D927_9LAMI|nr:hypothetical protein F511_13812 [Dorcoceras hygrometricum]
MDRGDDKMDMDLGETNGMLVEEDHRDDRIDLGENGLIIEARDNKIVLECDDMKNDQNQETGAVGSGESDGLSVGDVEDMVKPRGDDVLVADDDDWEGIERSDWRSICGGWLILSNMEEIGGQNWMVTRKSSCMDFIRLRWKGRVVSLNLWRSWCRPVPNGMHGKSSET